jgi:hypothetical protein
VQFEKPTKKQHPALSVMTPDTTPSNCHQYLSGLPPYLMSPESSQMSQFATEPLPDWQVKSLFKPEPSYQNLDIDVDYTNENAADSMSIRSEITRRLDENSVPNSRDAKATSSSRASWPAKCDCLVIGEQGQDKKEADRINQRNEDQPMQTNTPSSLRLLTPISVGETAFGHHSLPWSCENLSAAPGDLIPPPIESAQFPLSRDWDLMQANKATAPLSDSAYGSTMDSANKWFPKNSANKWACPFYVNDPGYFNANFYHAKKYINCAPWNGFERISRLKYIFQSPFSAIILAN